MFFSSAPIGASNPYLLYRVRRASHSYGLGPPDNGQTSEVVIDLHLVAENANSDLSVLVDLAEAVHTSMLSWSAPAGLDILNRELVSERADSFKEEARFYESHTMVYQLHVAAT